MSRSGWMGAGLVLVSLVVTLPLLELAVRLLAPVHYAGQHTRFIAHPHLVYLGNPLHQKINSAGFGDVERTLETAPGVVRIAAIGGSTTFGVGSWPTLLEKSLEQISNEFQVEVLNFGIDGFTTQESLINLAINVLDYDPDVLIIHHALNDLMPRLYREPERDYSHFRKAFSYEPGQIAGRSHLYLFVRELLHGEPSLANTSMTVNEAGIENPYMPDQLSGDGSVFTRNMRSMVSIAQGAGISVVLTTMPYSLDPNKLPAQWSIKHEIKVEGMVQHNQIIRELASEGGLPLVDLDAEMTGVEGFYFDHIHCNKSGNTRKADLIAASPGFMALIKAAQVRQ